MTRTDILTKAMAVAKRNGFDLSDDFFTEVPAETWVQEGQDLYFSLLFCHDFAICFFGEDIIVLDEFSDNAEELDLMDYENPATILMANRDNIKMISWQYHLIQMTLSEDPLSYVASFLENNNLI